MPSGQFGSGQLGNLELGSIPVLGPPGEIDLDSIEVQVELGSITVASVNTVVLDSIECQADVGPIALVQTVTLDSVEVTPSLGTITAASENTVILDSIEVAPSLGSIALVQTVTLGSIEVSPSLGSLSVTAVISLGSIECRPRLGEISVLSADNLTSLWIANRQYAWLADSFRIDRNLNSGATASFKLRYRSGLKPQPGDEVVMFWEGARRFAGIVKSVDEAALPGRDDQSFLTVNCSGYQALTDRVVVAKLYSISNTPPTGGLATIITYDLWSEHLIQLGVDYAYAEEGDPSADGYILSDQLFQYITLTEALNRLVQQTPGWNWYIDDYKTLHYRRTNPGGTANAPFVWTRSTDAFQGNTFESDSFQANDAAASPDELTYTKSRGSFRNRQWLLPSGDLKPLRVESHIADGSTRQWPTTYTLQSLH